jgi:alpha-N-acetylglucosamine transferase
MTTVFVTLSNNSYYAKGLQTVRELRENGKWTGDIVYIAVDFDPNPEDLQGVIIYNTTHINTDGLLQSFRKNPIKPMPDNRHFGKLYQWDKLQVFKPYFRKWDRVVFLDAGLRVFDSVQPLLDLPWKGRFLAPDDSEPNDNGNRFNCQLDLDANQMTNDVLFSEFSKDILQERYFLNCMFLFDSSLQFSFEEFEEAMNKYPICMCNEMGIMNLIFTYKLRVWNPFPELVNNKHLFGWCEYNYPGTNWKDFHFIKYSVTR